MNRRFDLCRPFSRPRRFVVCASKSGTVLFYKAEWTVLPSSRKRVRRSLLGTMRHLDRGVVSPPCDQPIQQHGTDPHLSRLHSSKWLEIDFQAPILFCTSKKHVRSRNTTRLAVGILWELVSKAEVKVRSARLLKAELWEKL